MGGVTNQEDLAPRPRWEWITDGEWPYGDFVGLSNLMISDW